MADIIDHRYFNSISLNLSYIKLLGMKTEASQFQELPDSWDVPNHGDKDRSRVPSVGRL